jgi:hypothetical protein
MLIDPEIIKKILQEKNAPTDCPQIVGPGTWRYLYDLLCGTESSKDLQKVLCLGTRTVNNEDDKHPTCEKCHLLGTVIIPMLEYRRKIGLPD